MIGPEVHRRLQSRPPSSDRDVVGRLTDRHGCIQSAKAIVEFVAAALDERRSCQKGLIGFTIFERIDRPRRAGGRVLCLPLLLESLARHAQTQWCTAHLVRVVVFLIEQRRHKRVAEAAILFCFGRRILDIADSRAGSIWRLLTSGDERQQRNQRDSVSQLSLKPRRLSEHRIRQGNAVAQQGTVSISFH